MIEGPTSTSTSTGFRLYQYWYLVILLWHRTLIAGPAQATWTHSACTRSIATSQRMNELVLVPVVPVDIVLLCFYVLEAFCHACHSAATNHLYFNH